MVTHAVTRLDGVAQINFLLNLSLSLFTTYLTGMMAKELSR